MLTTFKLYLLISPLQNYHFWEVAFFSPTTNERLEHRNKATVGESINESKMAYFSLMVGINDDTHFIYEQTKQTALRYMPQIFKTIHNNKNKKGKILNLCIFNMVFLSYILLQICTY